uniref:Proteoglycan 4a n=1 Tax=Poecilia latipinna TaxID=48699 RepID=A0A3B3UZZ4_9TELE
MLTSFVCCIKPSSSLLPRSCVGRCGEVFTRGQQCTCDFSCLQHKECCPDFLATCTTTPSCRGRCSETFRRGRTCDCDPLCVQYNTCCQDFQLHCGDGNTAVGPLPGQVSTSLGGTHQLSAVHLPRPSNGAPVLDGLMSNADLCSGSPINGLTALGNGTVLIFKGELFWAVDSVGGSIGPPQNIRDTLGVSSPIDTVFTRMDCSGNTYVIKGNQCWRLDENLMVKPGYPKPLTSEFPGLTGPISAALVVPATRNRLETIFFFKPGEFTVLPGSSASCRDKPKSSTLKNFAQQADVLLSGEINIKVSLTGFPSPVTSALSMPAPQSTNPYQLFVFSGPLYFRVQITGDLPVLVKPDPPASLTPLPNPVLSPLVMATNPANPAGQNQNPAHPTNSIRFWLRCP